MASIQIIGNHSINIDYSIEDGRVREFVFNGDVQFSEIQGISVEGWREKLVKAVIENDLHIDKDGCGLHAFVYKLQDDGILPAA